MNKLSLSTLLLLVLVSFTACSKRVENPRFVINEVLVINQENYVDDYGRRSGWIEIFNNTARTRHDASDQHRLNPRKYPIPKGDVLHELPPISTCCSGKR